MTRMAYALPAEAKGTRADGEARQRVRRNETGTRAAAMDDLYLGITHFTGRYTHWPLSSLRLRGILTASPLGGVARSCAALLSHRCPVALVTGWMRSGRD